MSYSSGWVGIARGFWGLGRKEEQTSKQHSNGDRLWGRTGQEGIDVVSCLGGNRAPFPTVRWGPDTFLRLLV